MEAERESQPLSVENDICSDRAELEFCLELHILRILGHVRYQPPACINSRQIPQEDATSASLLLLTGQLVCPRRIVPHPIAILNRCP